MAVEALSPQAIMDKQMEMHQQQMRDQLEMMKLKNVMDKDNDAVQGLKAVMDRGAKNREEMAKSLRG